MARWNMRGAVVAAWVVLGVAGGAAAPASAYSSLTIFGDSLADTGNVLSITTAVAPPAFPAFPGAEGRFSNGPVWTEGFAAALGLPNGAVNSNLLFNGSAVVPIGPQGGTNFSFGGARTGLGGSAGPTAGLIGELVAWNGSAFSGSLTRPADAGGLYVVQAGANDMRDFRSNAPGANTPVQAANNVVNAVGLLAQAGARHFLVSNLPDLGLTPEAAALGLVGASSTASIAFNAALAAGLTTLDAQFLAGFGVDLDIRNLDLFTLSTAVANDALNNNGATYGITNVTAPCIAPVAPLAYFAPGSTDINCAVSAFSDPLHPSARQGELIAAAAIAAVPEPASAALLAVAALGLAARRRRG